MGFKKSPLSFNLTLILFFFLLFSFYLLNSTLFDIGTLVAYPNNKVNRVLSENTGSSGSSSNTSTATPTYYPSDTHSPTPTYGNVSPSPTRSDYQLTSTPTYYQTNYDNSGTGSYSENKTYTTDRFTQVDSSTLSCISTVLTFSELERLRYLTPKTSEEESELRSLMDRSKVCFREYRETVKISEGGEKISSLTEELRKCLIAKVGETAFNEINSGARPSTSHEKERGESCFEENYHHQITYQADVDSLGSEIENCLIIAVGLNRFNEIKKGTSQPTFEERQKGERCFGASPHPLQKRPVYLVSDVVLACIKNSIDEQRYDEIHKGMTEPTEAEKEEALRCFGKINKVQEKILPIPPAQVPFLDEKEVIEIRSTFQENAEIADKVFDARLVLSGRAPEESLVDIYIFSEPIVVTTQTDENGDWVYRLSESISEGKHIAYAVVKDKNAQFVRSSIYNFEVLASPETEKILLEEEKATLVPSRYIYFAALLMIVAVSVVIISTLYLYRFRKKISADSGNGDGKGEL